MNRNLMLYTERLILTYTLFVAAILAAPHGFGQGTNFCGPKKLPGTTLFPTIDFGSIAVREGLPNGSVIAQRYVNMDNMICYRDSVTFQATMQGAPTAYPNVFTTSVRGVGVRVSLGSYDPPRYVPYQNYYPGSWSGQWIVQNPFKVELIKLGPIDAGASLSGTFYEGHVKGGGSEAFAWANFTGGTFRNISCTTQDVLVRLPAVGLSAFVPDRVAGRTPFAISIHCASSDVLNGIDYQFSNVTDVVYPANGVIALDGASSAKGVGIQIMDQQNYAPIQFQHRYTMAHFTPGQTLYRIPLIAAYYRIGDVQPGTVNSSMEFTLYYQ